MTEPAVDATGRWRATSESWLRAALVVWPALVVLAVDPWGWFPFGPVKWLVVSVGVPVLLALASRRLLVFVPRLQWLSLATIGLMAVAALVAGTGWLPWLGTEDRHLGVLTWILCASALLVGQSLGPRLLDGLWWGIALAGLGLGAVSTAEALGWEPRVLDVDDRLTATFGSAAYLGAATALLLPAVAALAIDRRGPRARRLLAGLAVPLLLVAAVGSGARAAWFGLGVAVVVVVAVNARAVVTGIRRHPVRGAAVATAAVAGMALVLLLTPAGERLSGLSDPDRAGGTSRADEWRVAVTVVARHPVLGTGPEGYRAAFVDGVDGDYVRAHGREVAVDRAHSAPLDVALAGGLVALVVWAAWLVVAARFVGRGLRVGRAAPPLLGLGAGVVAYLASQLLLFPLAELDPLAWLLAGAVIGATARSDEIRQRVIGGWLTAVAVVVAVAALVGGVAGVVADQRARRATVLVAGGDEELALAEVDGALTLRRDSVRLHLLRADLLLDAGRGTTEAIAAVDDALVIAPGDPVVARRRAELLVVRAEATQVPDHVAGARAAVEARLAADPHDPGLWLLSARVAAIEGRNDDAGTDVARALALDPDDPEAQAMRERLEVRR